MNELYSELVLDLYRNPPNRGKLQPHNVRASGGNPSCGDAVTFTLWMENGIVKDIKFENEGCAISTAMQALLTEHVKGKPVAEIQRITEQNALEWLGGSITPTRQKCATFALKILQKELRAVEQRNK
ncbi:MAG: SUF system NifU family Fe-S cluster assembly protein [Candidatus Diapherotrites archaeon]|nr:SUF system NifU family Fe-S cluster assembly protein [Candidatus Diapherotrites archaeon]